MATIYHRTALTGGAATALDSIDGVSLADGDFAYIHNVATDVFYAYRLVAASGAAESSPDVISPDANAGTKRWVLQQAYGAGGGSSVSKFDAVVDASGGGDYLTIAAAFAGGARKILIRKGSYTLNSVVYQPSVAEEVILEGEGGVVITLDKATGSDGFFDWYTNSASIQTYALLNSPSISYDAPTKTITFDAADPTTVFTAGDQFCFDDHAQLGVFSIESINATTITLVYGLPCTTFTSLVSPSMVKRPAVSSMPSFIVRKLTFEEAATNSEYLLGTNAERLWFRQLSFEDCVFNGIGTIGTMLEYNTWAFDVSYYRDCTFNDVGRTYGAGDFIHCTLEGSFVSYSPSSDYYDCLLGGSVAVRSATLGFKSALLPGFKHRKISGCRIAGSTWTADMTQFDLSGSSGSYTDVNGGLVLLGDAVYKWTTLTATKTLDVDERNVLSNHAATATYTIPSTSILQADAVFRVKDITGNAATNNIIVATEGAETIDGAASITISTNYGSVELISNGTNLFTV